MFLKAENLQRSGSFKFRGAYNAITSLGPKAQDGIVAYSSGNHGQAVALAARLRQVKAVIVLPEDVSVTKLAAVRAYGAEVVTYDRFEKDEIAVASDIATARGSVIVAAVENPAVIAGQGTVAAELLDEVTDLDVLLVPVGGAGLIAGCAMATKSMNPRARVVGVEPEASDALRRSLLAGEIVRIPQATTIGDGLRAPAPGRLPFEIAKRYVDEVVTVDDDALRDAMILLFERLKIVVEPSGAAGVAALLSQRIATPGLKVGVVISGGNIGADAFSALTQTRQRVA